MTAAPRRIPNGRPALMVLTGDAPAIATCERLGTTERRFGSAHIPAR